MGRPFSGGSSVKCYVDGEMVSSDKCRYAKVSDALTRCTIGTEYIPTIEGSGPINYEKVFLFVGQMGPIYMFCEALTAEQIKIIHSLGPSYMYSFIGDEILVAPDVSPLDAILDAKDGLSSKIIFGLNAQASSGSDLFNVSSMIDNSPDKSLIVAAVMEGTQLCSRRLLQEIIYCVGGVTVFFPLLTLFNGSESDDAQREYMLIKTITRDKLAVDVIGLISSVLDGNLSNQQQMHLLAGLSILGFLFQSVPPQQLNLEALTGLKHLFGVLQASGNRLNFQRNSFSVLDCLPCIIDVICHFYWDKADGGPVIGSKLLCDSITKQVIGQRPGRDEVRKIRLLLLSLAEMSLRQRISTSDIKALIAFFERSQDMVCIEDVLHMVIRSLSHKQLLASFLEQVNLLGGCHLFINLLQRELEPIRLLGLQFLDNLRKGGNTNLQPVFSAISEKLFAFPLSDHLYATLFDVLLGGASPKQVLQRCNSSESSKNKKPTSNSLSSPFLVPQIFVCIFRFLASCNDKASRTKILEDLLDLLESELSNTEAFMEHAWSSWLTTSVKLITLNNCEWELKSQDDTSRIHEIALIRNLYCVVLSHYVYSVKGGWYMLEETVNFLLLNYEQGRMLHSNFLREIFEDLVGSLFKVSSEENIFVSQPCRDNTLYLLKLADELFISEYGDKFPFLEFGMSSSMPSDLPLSENQDISSAVLEVLNLEYKDILSRTCWSHNSTAEEADVEDVRWVLYDKLWSLITEMSGKGQKMAAVVVSGGIGTALGAKPTKYIDKAMLLRGEKCPRIVFHLLLLYLFCYGNVLVYMQAAEEAKYTKDTKDERKKQLEVLKAKLDEFSLAEHVQLKAFEEDIMSAIDKIISSNDSRKVAFQLAYDEHQQIVTDSWIRMFRTLIDERGPWSANPFPNNNVTHWKLDKTEDNWASTKAQTQLQIL
ncbi:hypothetical protein HPP92_013164 [Vanilla planifolia]|uniref:DUF4704 domain-containing protein n=1 Tax=Vanilla planifolia TaxID=51239 RepID=A0A835QR68_VANPL|nr:hypothetical protein HPP92_013164 [Vanilla planifolia]